MQDILSLLSTSLSDMAVILENMRASQAMEADIASAIEARVKAEHLRQQYRQFCDDCRRDLDSIEADAGLPTFNEWRDCRVNIDALYSLETKFKGVRP